jgi:hypothetical protein
MGWSWSAVATKWIKEGTTMVLNEFDKKKGLLIIQNSYFFFHF